MYCFIALFLFIVNITAQTSGKCGDQCTWTYSETTLKLTGIGKGEMQKIYADNLVPWKHLKDSITKITLSGIKIISQKSFQNMPQLKTIEFGEVTEIGQGAFYNTGIESVTITEHIQKINKNAFEQCEKLKTVEFSTNSQLETIEERVFSNCVSLKSIVLPESLVRLEKKVFEGCSNLSMIQIGNKVEKIGDHLFVKCFH